MTDIFDFEKKSQLFAVMGNPVSHSKSPRIHTLFAKQTGVHIEYQRIQVDVGGFAQAISNFQASGGRGLNITVPFKIEAFGLADELSPRARTAGAVNTLWFEKRVIHGDNTDGVGLLRDLNANLNCPPHGKNILLLGAGGAARGVLGPLLEAAPLGLTLANRSVDRAEALQEIFAARGPITACGFSSLHGKRFDMVINATAASLRDELPPLPEHLFSDDGLAYDLAYSDKPTVFMEWARGHGARRISDGLGMLVEQAAESFTIWHGQKPDTATVIQALRHP